MLVSKQYIQQKGPPLLVAKVAQGTVEEPALVIIYKLSHQMRVVSKLRMKSWEIVDQLSQLIDCFIDMDSVFEYQIGDRVSIPGLALRN